MGENGRDRSGQPGLLTRPPDCGGDGPDWAKWNVVDPVRQIEALDDLLRRGLLSVEDFERHKAKVLYR
jgi:hypothetical protein